MINLVEQNKWALEVVGLSADYEPADDAVNLIDKYEQLLEELDSEEDYEQFFEAVNVAINNLSVFEDQLFCEVIFGM